MPVLNEPDLLERYQTLLYHLVDQGQQRLYLFRAVYDFQGE
jgi:hypothetical protein